MLFQQYFSWLIDYIGEDMNKEAGLYHQPKEGQAFGVVMNKIACINFLRSAT